MSRPTTTLCHIFSSSRIFPRCDRSKHNRKATCWTSYDFFMGTSKFLCRIFIFQQREVNLNAPRKEWLEQETYYHVRSQLLFHSTPLSHWSVFSGPGNLWKQWMFRLYIYTTNYESNCGRKLCLWVCVILDRKWLSAAETTNGSVADASQFPSASLSDLNAFHYLDFSWSIYNEIIFLWIFTASWGQENHNIIKHLGDIA